MATDLAIVWQHPTTDVRLKKRIIRTLIHEVIADVDLAASEVVLIVHWQGGVHTELRLPRRRRGQSGSHTPKEIIEAVRVLVRLCSDDAIASLLNRNGLRTGRGNRWTRERVVALRSAHHLPPYCPERCAAEGWMNLTQAAQCLGVSAKTLRLAVQRGEFEAEHPLSEGPWVFNRGALQTEAARQFVARVRSRCSTPAGPTSEQTSLDLSMT